MENEFVIYFKDLNKDAQERLLKEAGLESPADANWDVFSIATVILGEGDS